jgi:lipid II:glycine glycyltransferase (peptidoglycan interpeptide bridge formation enzyme)
MTTPTTGTPAPDWDDQLAKLGGHLYQSRAWAEFQQTQGRPVMYAADTDWSWMAALRHGRGGINYLYAPYGPTLQGSNAEAALTSLLEAGRTAGADFIRFEPLGTVTPTELRRFGAHLVAEMQPRYRLTLDLAPDEAQLRGAISSSNRNLINTAEKRGLTFRTSSDPADMAEFLAMQRQTAERQHITMHPDTYYHQLAQVLFPTATARLYFADHDGHPIASAICIDFAGTRYYVYAATYYELNKQHKAAIALLWWLIMEAKSKGLTRFDYGGIAPEDQPNHPWAGHTKFKKSIGGEIITSVGTWEIPIKLTKYQLYRMARKVLPV